MIKHMLASLLMFCFVGAPAMADTVLAEQINGISDLIQQRWTPTEPGGGVIIMKNGEVIFETYRGVSDIEQQTPISATTIFPYASITKRFTATTILSLVESDKINLDAAVGDYLAELAEPLSLITIRQLLTHSSGIPDNFKAQFDQEYSTQDHIKKISALELQFEPGTKSTYSNNGYNLLGAVIERVTGKAWHDTVIERVVAPLELPSIKYLQHHMTGDSKLIIGYHQNLLDFPLAPVKTASLLHANGSLAGTLTDLTLWVKAFHDAEIISRQSVDTALKKRTLPDGKPGWAMGLFRFEFAGSEVIVHDGGANGVNAYTLYIPATNTLVVTGSNVPADARNLAFDITKLLLGFPSKTFVETPVNTDSITPLLGTYKYSNDKTHSLFLHEGALFLRYGKGRPVQAIAANEDNTFFFKRKADWFQIKQTSDGTQEFHWHRTGREKADIAVKKSPAAN